MSKKIIKYVNLICSQHVLWAIILGFGYFILNYSQTPPHNVGYGDSDELLTVAFNRGIAHPPGYPLYILLLNLFLKLPIPAPSVAFMGHTFSNLTSSLTIAIVYLTCVNLYLLIKKNSFKNIKLFSGHFEQWWFSLISTLSLAFTFQFWLYSHIAEKYSLAALITAFWMFLTIKILTIKKVNLSLWFTYGIILGLGVSHLQSLILLLIPSAYLFYQKQQHSWQKEAAAFISAFIVAVTISISLIFYFHSQSPTVSWHFTPTLQGIYDLVTRKDFAGLRYASGKEAGAYFDSFDINKFTHGVISYIKILIAHSGWWTLILILLALRFGKSRLKSGFWVIVTAVGLLTLGIAGYIGMPDDSGSQAITMRQYIPGFVSLVFLFYLGWFELTKRFLAAGKLLIPKLIPFILIIVPSLLLLFQAYSKYPQADLSNYDQISNRYKDMLPQFDPDSIVTCYSDISCFALLYEKYVNQTRQDLTIVPMAYPLIEDQVNNPEIRGFTDTYTSNPYLTIDIITWNINDKTIYAVELSSTYYNLLGLNGPFMFYVPTGAMGELTHYLPEELPLPQTKYVEAWLNTNTHPLDPMRIFHKSTIVRDFIINGTMYEKMDVRDWALEQFNLASNLVFQMDEADQKQFSALRNELEHIQPDENFSPGTSIPSVDDLLEPVPNFFDNNQLNRAFTYAHAAMARDPKNVTARIWLGKIYEELGDINFAKIEYKNALIIDPDNPEAKDKYQRLSQEFNL